VLRYVPRVSRLIESRHGAVARWRRAAPLIADQFRGAAYYVDKIFGGATPGELAVEQPTRYLFVINRKTARALGLILPPELLLRADAVIE